MIKLPQTYSTLKLEEASVDEVEQHFIKTFGPVFKTSKTSKIDVSHIIFRAQCRSIPEWRIHVFDIYRSDLSNRKSERERLFEAIKTAAKQGSKVPTSIANAKPSNDDVNFKSEEKRLAEYLKLAKYSDLDPNQTYNEHSLFIMMNEGRFDAAAQIYHSANKAKKLRWNQFLIF